MRQRLPLWIIACALIAAGAVYLWKRGGPGERGAAVQSTNLPQATAKPVNPAQPEPEPVALLSQPSPVNFAEALATAYAKQNRARFPNRLSNTSLPLKQLQARDSAILLQNA